MKITESDSAREAGFYRMSAAAYHAGPCSAPELSSSLCKILAEESPLHAWAIHPKLGRAPVEDEEPTEDEERKSSGIQDLGSAIHKLVLGYGNEIVVIDPLDHKGPRGGIPKGYTNDSIKVARDEARGLGRIPILTKYHDRAQQVHVSLRKRAEHWLGCPIEDCLREIVIVWEEDGFWRKAMLDIARPDLLRAADLKSTGIKTNPETLQRHLYSQGLHIQETFYLRGLDALDPLNCGRRQFAFLFGETKAPFVASRPMMLPESGKHLGRMLVNRACATWDACVKSGIWPDYGDEPCMAEPSPWLMGELEQEATE